jgi:hypothetical protein
MVVKTVREYMRALLKVHTLLTEEQLVTHKSFLEDVLEALFMLVEWYCDKT